MSDLKNTFPADGDKITIRDGILTVPDHPVIPFIEGDGTGPDIWRAAVRVLDAAVAKAYSGKKKIAWMEVFAGEKSFNMGLGWLPDETLAAFREYLVGIKGPLTTPIGGGITSLNVALRQQLDLYVCLRPVRYIKGVPSPVKRPELVDMVIFRENTEDIYAGIEWAEGTPEAKKVIAFLQQEMGVKKIRFPETSGIGVKPVSREGSERLIEAAIEFALKQGRTSVTIVHKGNIMKFTEGAFKSWGYALAATKYRDRTVSQRETWVLENKEKDSSLSRENLACAIEPGFDNMTPNQKEGVLSEVDATLALWPTHGAGKWKKMLLIKDSIADITLQQTITRADEFDVLATTNLNGDYLSDAIAAQVGGIGIAPGGNINYRTGHAIFEATHGTAPKYANLDKVNPGSIILSGVMLLEYLGWSEAAAFINASLDRTIEQRKVTYDFARLMRAENVEGVQEVKCSEFADELIRNL